MQQLFRLLILFLNQPYIIRATNSPILRSTLWLPIQLLVQCTDTAADQCHDWYGTPLSSILTVAPVGSSIGSLHQMLYMQSKMLLRMGEFVVRNILGWFKKVNKRQSCCILLVVYNVDFSITLLMCIAIIFTYRVMLTRAWSSWWRNDISRPNTWISKSMQDINKCFNGSTCASITQNT